MDRKVVVGTATKASDQNYGIKLTGDANYVGLDTDKFDEIWTNPATVDRTYTFPNPASKTGRKIRCRNIGNGTNKVMLLPFGATKILVYSGDEKWELASFELLQQDDWAEFISDGTAWAKCNVPYWHKFDDPATGTKASKLWAANWDDFSAGLSVTFSEAPIGSLAVRCSITKDATTIVYYRKSGDSNISNTPQASQEYSHRIGSGGTDTKLLVFWLSSGRAVQITISSGAITIYVPYPIGYLQ